MRPRVTLAVVSTVLVVGFGDMSSGNRVTAQTGERAAGGDARVTADEFERWMTELSNCGRWGADDELGTLNLISSEKRIHAASLVQSGVTVSLSRPLRLGRNVTFQRGFDNVFADGGSGLGERVAWIEEQHRIGYHGSPLTHLDALCHVAWDGMTYNGRVYAEMATEAAGCTQNEAWEQRTGITIGATRLNRWEFMSHSRLSQLTMGPGQP